MTPRAVIGSATRADFDVGEPSLTTRIHLVGGGHPSIVERAVARGELAATPPARIVALPADLVRNELFMTMTAATPETIIDIVDNVFLPLATKFT